MRVIFEIEVPNDGFVTDGWQNEVRSIVKTYFRDDIEASFHVHDIPDDDASAEYDSATDEFTPM